MTKDTIPIHQQVAFKQAFKEMQVVGVLKPVEYVTCWINSLSSERNMKKQENIISDSVKTLPISTNVIVREPFYYRTLNDNLPQPFTTLYVHHCRFFKRILIYGAWLSSIYQYRLLIFPFGKFRLMRMPLGLTVAGDAHECKLVAIFSRLNFVTGIVDDMITWREQADRTDHAVHITEFMHLIR